MSVRTYNLLGLRHTVCSCQTTHDMNTVLTTHEQYVIACITIRHINIKICHIPRYMMDTLRRRAIQVLTASFLYIYDKWSSVQRTASVYMVWMLIKCMALARRRNNRIIWASTSGQDITGLMIAFYMLDRVCSTYSLQSWLRYSHMLIRPVTIVFINRGAICISHIDTDVDTELNSMVSFSGDMCLDNLPYISNPLQHNILTYA